VQAVVCGHTLALAGSNPITDLQFALPAIRTETYINVMAVLTELTHVLDLRNLVLAWLRNATELKGEVPDATSSAVAAASQPAASASAAAAPAVSALSALLT
jgi:hypothetical protein